ncbi:MAG: LemA family protein [Pseudomonadota bacterium]
MTFAILGGIVLLAGIYLISLYNRMVSDRQTVDSAWSDIDVQLKRRYNLIPNLVETVKGHARHERETLDSVVEARAQAVSNTGTPAQQAASEGQLNLALRGMLAIAENYPDLKASENFRTLQSQLADIETAIQAARRYFNGAVRQFNTRIGQFPGNLIAGRFGFQEAEYFELPETSAARDPVAVKF